MYLKKNFNDFRFLQLPIHRKTLKILTWDIYSFMIAVIFFFCHRHLNLCTKMYPWLQILSSPKKKESEGEVALSYLTLCSPMDCSLPSSSVHGIFQERILAWAAISFSRASSQPRDRTQVPCIADRQVTVWATREGIMIHKLSSPLPLQSSFSRSNWEAVSYTFILGRNLNKT